MPPCPLSSEPWSYSVDTAHSTPCGWSAGNDCQQGQVWRAGAGKEQGHAGKGGQGQARVGRDKGRQEQGWARSGKSGQGWASVGKGRQGWASKGKVRQGRAGARAGKGVQGRQGWARAGRHPPRRQARYPSGSRFQSTHRRPALFALTSLTNMVLSSWAWCCPRLCDSGAGRGGQHTTSDQRCRRVRAGRAAGRVGRE